MSRESIIEKLESIDGVDVSDIIQDVQNVFDDMEDLKHDLRRAKDDWTFGSSIFSRRPIL